VSDKRVAVNTHKLLTVWWTLLDSSCLWKIPVWTLILGKTSLHISEIGRFTAWDCCNTARPLRPWLVENDVILVWTLILYRIWSISLGISKRRECACLSPVNCDFLIISSVWFHSHGCVSSGGLWVVTKLWLLRRWNLALIHSAVRIDTYLLHWPKIKGYGLTLDWTQR
jgi:hypothetical protein